FEQLGLWRLGRQCCVENHPFLVHRFIARSGRESGGPTLLCEAHGREDYGDRGEPPIDPVSSERGRQSHRGGVSSRCHRASTIGWRILAPHSTQLHQEQTTTSAPECQAGPSDPQEALTCVLRFLGGSSSSCRASRFSLR